MGSKGREQMKGIFGKFGNNLDEEKKRGGVSRSCLGEGWMLFQKEA